jgi:hypothetical protein
MTGLIGYWHPRGRVGFALRIVANRCVRYDRGWREQGFVQAPTFWRPFQLRQIQPLTGCSCTKPVLFRYRFDEKPALNRPPHCEPVFARANPKPGRRPVKTAAKSRPESLPRIDACFGHRGQGQGIWLPGADQRNLGPFPPQETAFYGESTETFEPRNDLAAKRPDPVM